MRKFTLNIRRQIREFDSPLVMGILNVTPDSFYSGSRTLKSADAAEALNRPAVKAMAQRLLAEGADIIDIGGCSTRPGSDSVSELQEMERVHLGISVVRELSAEVMISVDTFRSTVAARSIEWGADIINDISAGLMDEQMIPTVAQLGVPYIMMHTRGTPDTMGSLTDYPDGVVVGVASELREQVVKASLAGIGDIIIDPGLGFAKTAAQNYELLAGTRELQMLLDNRPILIGLSRKSMIYKPLGITPADSLPGTIALNAIALELGAAIIRVHDVAPARQTVAVMSQFPSAEAD
jgi:dihydropteroate synthase